jgi:hypothetical protein
LFRYYPAAFRRPERAPAASRSPREQPARRPVPFREEHAMAETTTDHNTIKKWAEKHGGKPAAVESTHSKGDVGIIRLMFPKAPHSDHDHLVEISWDEFFKEFDQRKLALIYEENSMFSKLVGRDSVKEREKEGAR